jgi:oligopeptide transport system permease protein
LVRFIVKRVIYSLVTMWVIITITFLLMHSLPGQPFNHPERLTPQILANLKHKYGLDQPLIQQYFIYLGHIATGDFGTSFRYEDQSVTSIIASRFPVSAELGLEALLFAVGFGLILGVVAALHHNKAWDYVTMGVAVVGVSVPSIVLGPLLSYYVGVKLGWLPAGLWGGFSSTILPSLTLGLGALALIARLVRTSMLEVIHQDYVRTAVAKGLSQWQVLTRHILRNSVLPVVTILGPLVVNLITGSIVVEEIFAIPGLGQYFVNSILDNDYTVIMGTTVFYSFLYIVSLLIVDIAYGFIDPRIRLATGEE